MDVTATGSAASALAASTGTGSTAVGKDQFLKLLITQLQNQDPLEPQKDTEFVAQLATFSSLEQLMGVNSNLQVLGAYQSNLVNSQALNLIGKEALTPAGDSVRIRDGQPEELLYTLPSGATQATLTVYDKSGNAVRTIALDPEAPARSAVAWDGKDDRGNVLADGEYRIELKALDAQGQSVGSSLYRVVSIDGVNFEGGVMSLISGNDVIPFDSIIEIRAGRS